VNVAAESVNRVVLTPGSAYTLFPIIVHGIPMGNSSVGITSSLYLSPSEFLYQLKAFHSY